MSPGGVLVAAIPLLFRCAADAMYAGMAFVPISGIAMMWFSGNAVPAIG